jgi:hypothetical protein
VVTVRPGRVRPVPHRFPPRLFRALCLVSAACLAAAPGAAADWKRLDTRHFTVVGDAEARTLRQVAEQFERFRETLGRVLGDRATASPVPTIVLVFPSERAFAPLRPSFEGKAVPVSGQFVGSSDVNYIAVVADRADGMRVVFHEYAHLVSANLGRNVPAWLEEGLAEYYSTYAPARGGREAVLGNPIAAHLIHLREARLLTLDELLRVTRDSPLYNEGERRSLFYAQSWALTHMLLAGEPSRRTQLSAYLARLAGGGDAIDAWRQIFGDSPVERELKRYVSRNVFRAHRYTFADELGSVEGQATPIARGDGEAFLADLLQQQGRLTEATERLAAASAPGAASAWMRTVAASLALKRQDPAGAERMLGDVGEVRDWLTAYRAGAVLAEAGAGGDERPTASQVAGVRRLFETARQGGRAFPQATARLAEIELATEQGPSPDLTAAMAQARHLAPGRDEYVALHAQLLAHDGAFADARRLAATMLGPPYPADVRQHAASLMTYIAQLERAYGGSTADEPVLPADRVGRPGVPVSEADYRAVVTGEQRVVGTMERIDCDGSTAIFRIRTGDETLIFTAPELPAVNFVTYRSDLGRTIACGPLLEPARVALTWKPGAREGERLAVLVEFLAVRTPR